MTLEKEAAGVVEAAALPVPVAGTLERSGVPATAARGGTRPGTARSWQQALAAGVLWTDVLAVCAAVALGYVLRFDRAIDVGILQPRGALYILISVVLAEAWVLALGLSGARSPRVLASGREEIVRVVRGTLVLFGTAAAVCYLVKFDLARSYVAVTLPVGLALLLAGRWMRTRYVRAERARGNFQRRTVLVGARDTVVDLAARMRKAHETGFEVVGVCVPGGTRRPSPVAGVPVLGDVGQAAEVALSAGADAVAVAPSDAATPQAIKQLAWDLEPSGAELLVMPALADVAAPRLVVTPVDGVPCVAVAPPQFTGGQNALKRAFDVVVATCALAVLALPLLLVAAAVRLTSPGPALFRQERVGLRGEPFQVFKFRTMRVGAEAALEEALGGEAGLFYKPKDDPRVTRIGKFLRRYSIDEFPQLLNVLRGDMSLVGPRPQVPLEVAQYDAAVRRRLLVKPGMTGLWQVSGRNDLPVDQSVRLDLYYVENWTLLGDVGILLRTARAVVSRQGAY